jgi:hypothetical protein
MNETLEQQFTDLLEALSETTDSNFSGAGIILYDNPTQLANYHCDLVKNAIIPNDLKLGSTALLSYLIKISSYQHPYHDGFHFINSQGLLTHVAQFVSPPISTQLRNLGANGARTFCSQCSSSIEGVLMIGSVSSSRKISVFQNGKILQQA